MRIEFPAFLTLPSSMLSTPSSLAISWTFLSVPLKAKEDVLAVTSRLGILVRLFNISVEKTTILRSFLVCGVLKYQFFINTRTYCGVMNP